MFRKPKHEDRLDDVIDSLILDLQGFSGTDDEYAKMVKQLDMLYKMQANDKPDRVSMDALATITANLAGILMILHFEKVNVMTSKAMSFVMKAR